MSSDCRQYQLRTIRRKYLCQTEGHAELKQSSKQGYENFIKINISVQKPMAMNIIQIGMVHVQYRHVVRREQVLFFYVLTSHIETL